MQKVKHAAARTVTGSVIEFDRVSHAYDGRTGPVTALNDISFTAKAGEFVALLGPSGCGKSTLLSIAGGLVRPSKGQVLLDGKLVSKPNTQLGFVFQEATLLDWRTALRNVLLQAEARGMDNQEALVRARKLMHRAGLADFEGALPSQLSGGMRQRVSICRALLHDPPVLMMDEPFGALDAMTREQMVLDLQQIWMEGRKTVLFVTHDIPEAILLADRIVVLAARPGRLLKEFEIELPRPRSVEDLARPEMVELQQEIRGLLRGSGAFEPAA